MDLTTLQGPVVRRLISANPGLKYFPGFFVPLFESLSLIISLFFEGHPVIKLSTKMVVLNFLLKLSDLKLDFTLTLSYLNQALNNQAQNSKM